MLKILILPVKQKNSFTQIFIIFENDQLEQFYFEKLSADGGKSFLPEPQKHTEHFCFRE